jgi:hypothetical protein
MRPDSLIHRQHKIVSNPSSVADYTLSPDRKVSLTSTEQRQAAKRYCERDLIHDRSVTAVQSPYAPDSRGHCYKYFNNAE